LKTPRKSSRTAGGRASRDLRIGVGAEIHRLRLDAGLSIRRLAEAAGIHATHVSLIERGHREPSLAVLVGLATALGGDVRVRIYPGTGPRIRDPIQARMVEALLRILHVRWMRRLEVPVYRPVRGVIDLVLTDPIARLVAATEFQSEMPRLEQQLRWSHEKAGALASASIWQPGEDPLRIDRLLVLRNTYANRRIAERFAETLATDFPSRALGAYRSLSTSDAPWPGSALLWANVDGDHAEILDHPPRGISVGR
jgi:transcriptional regulator with XRE-family HTH domain